MAETGRTRPTAAITAAFGTPSSIVGGMVSHAYYSRCARTCGLTVAIVFYLLVCPAPSEDSTHTHTHTHTAGERMQRHTQRVNACSGTHAYTKAYFLH